MFADTKDRERASGGPVVNLTRQVGPTQGFDLNVVPHRAGDAGHRPNGEEKAQPNLLRAVHFDFVQYDERHRQQGEIENNVNNAQADAESDPVHASLSHLTVPDHAEMRGRWVTFEKFQEQCCENVANEKKEKGIMCHHPSSRCQASETPIEQRDGDLDHTNREVEKDLGDRG